GPPAAAEGAAGSLEAALAQLARLKAATLAGLLPAARALLPGLEESQEFLGRVGDLLIGIYALDSALTRALQARQDAPAEAALHAQVATYLAWRTVPGLRRA